MDRQWILPPAIIELNLDLFGGGSGATGSGACKIIKNNETEHESDYLEKICECIVDYNKCIRLSIDNNPDNYLPQVVETRDPFVC